MQTEPAEARFRKVFQTHFDAINRYCLRRISIEEVNDVVAETFAVAWRKKERIPEVSDQLPWLYGIARNEIRNRHRSLRRLKALKSKLGGQAHQTDAGPEPIVVRNEDLRQVMDALSSLSPRDREVLLLRTHEELDYEQLGVALSCSPEAARKRLSRAIDRLRRAGGFTKPLPAAQVRAMEGGDR